MDSCCRTLFYHYTLVEIMRLYHGYRQLDKQAKKQVQKRATAYLTRLQRGGKGSNSRQMCPLNEKDRCMLYAFRPMICRLHGIPYILKSPGRQPAEGPGCWLFSQQQDGNPPVSFDRTRLYALMAEIEKDLRQTLGFAERLKLTVADMLILFESEDE